MRFSATELYQTGGEHYVAKLDEGTLIKWRRRDAPPKSFREMDEQLSWLRELEVPIPKTSIYGPSQIQLNGERNEVPYCIVMETIKGIHIRGRDLSAPGVKRDLELMLAASKDLEGKSGFSLDLFGLGAPLKTWLSPDALLSKNLIVHDRGVALVDTSLRAVDVPGSISQSIGMRLRKITQSAFMKRVCQQ